MITQHSMPACNNACWSLGELPCLPGYVCSTYMSWSASVPHHACQCGGSCRWCRRQTFPFSLPMLPQLLGCSLLLAVRASPVCCGCPACATRGCVLWHASSRHAFHRRPHASAKLTCDELAAGPPCEPATSGLASEAAGVQVSWQSRRSQRSWQAWPCRCWSGWCPSCLLPWAPCPAASWRTAPSPLAGECSSLSPQGGLEPGCSEPRCRVECRDARACRRLIVCRAACWVRAASPAHPAQPCQLRPSCPSWTGRALNSAHCRLAERLMFQPFCPPESSRGSIWHLL